MYRGKQANERQTELWFPLRVVSHEHEGGVDRRKKMKLFWDGCHSNIISKGGLGTCRDVSIAMPCVYLDKYHMLQSCL